MQADAHKLMREGDCRRLQTIARQCVQGQAAGAELELIAWHHRSDCPPAARQLLAALLAARGEPGMAQRVLERIDHLTDEAALLMLSLCILRRWDDSAGKLASRLTEQAQGAAIAPILAAMGFAQPRLAVEAHSQATDLARSLAAQPAMIRTLVFVQKQAPEAKDIMLLRRALSLIAEQEIRDSTLVFEARAELALLAGDHAEAGRLARQGLAMDPYHAPLALILANADDHPAAHAEEAQPTVREILQRVTDRWPGYADVRAAWIRRLFRDGDAVRAREVSTRWLAEEPQSSVARQVAREVAA